MIWKTKIQEYQSAWQWKNCVIFSMAMAARALSLVLFFFCLKSLALEGIGQYLTLLSGEGKPEKVIKGPIPERYFERYTLQKEFCENV